MRRLLTSFLLLSVVACAAPWPERNSDLPDDPGLRRGQLGNGLRYLILHNAEPKDRVSMRLLVAAGSLMENDDERGLAHFVEHMAFRGTRAFPNGSLVEALQRLGIGHGPDNTAFTGFEHTIYHLELPDTKDATLHEGLRAFREYAEGITFDEKLIERERGVVLSELATRDTPQSRGSDANLQFLWPSARETSRKPIGTPESIRGFTREQFVAFYDAWYRPERMAVIIVGDLDPAAAERELTAMFASFAARAPARPEPPEPKPTEVATPDISLFTDPGLVGFTLSFERPVYYLRPADTHARRIGDLHLGLAFAMFQARLQRLTKLPDASFLVPTASVSTALRNWRLVSLSVNGKIDDWQKVATDLEQEHRRAFQHGFTAHELEEVRASFATSYEQSVRSAPTRPSGSIAQQLATAVLYGTAFPSPVTVQQDVAAELATVTANDCLQAFRAAWTANAMSVFIASNPAFRITRGQIAATLNASREHDVAKPPEQAAAEFAYGNFGPPGKLVREEQLADLDLRLTEFANGVRFNFKTTRFESDIVDVHVRVGEGQLTQPATLPGLNLIADAVTTAGGLGHHTMDELSSLLAGRAVSVSFQVQSDACVFSARCARRDLKLGLQIIAAYLTDASYRPAALREGRAAFNSMYAALNASPTGPITAFALRDMTGDRRFGAPQAEELAARDLPETKAWLEPQFKRGPVELSVVGDIPWEEAREAVASTLGTLPRREVRAAAIRGEEVKPLPVPAKTKAYGVDPKLRQTAIAWYWPATVKDIHEERRCNLLARALAERFRLRLREELGAAYSPAAAFVNVNGFPHLCYFVVSAELEPSRAATAIEILTRETTALATKGLTPDEFERAKQPYLHDMTDNLRTNAYWGMTVLSDAQQNPARIAAARDRAADIVAITREEIGAMAQRHLAPEHAFKFVTIQAPASAPPR